MQIHVVVHGRRPHPDRSVIDQPRLERQSQSECTLNDMRIVFDHIRSELTSRLAGFQYDLNGETIKLIADDDQLTRERLSIVDEVITEAIAKI